MLLQRKTQLREDTQDTHRRTHTGNKANKAFSASLHYFFAHFLILVFVSRILIILKVLFDLTEVCRQVNIVNPPPSIYTMQTHCNIVCTIVDGGRNIFAKIVFAWAAVLSGKAHFWIIITQYSLTLFAARCSVCSLEWGRKYECSIHQIYLVVEIFYKIYLYQCA